MTTETSRAYQPVAALSRLARRLGPPLSPRRHPQANLARGSSRMAPGARGGCAPAGCGLMFDPIVLEPFRHMLEGSF